MPASPTPDAWFKAAESGDLASLSRWERQGVLRKLRFDPQKTKAVPGDGRPTLARLLNGKNQTALQVALSCHQVAYACALLEKDRFPPLDNPPTSRRGQADAYVSPLEMAVFLKAPHAEFERVVTLLMKQGHNLNQESADRLSPLEHAIERGHSERARFLLENGARVVCIGAKEPPFFTAVGSGSLEMTQLLLDFGQDINATHFNSPNHTPLMLACVLWKDEKDTACQNMVAWLLQNGADPSLTTVVDGKTENAVNDFLRPALIPVFQLEVAKAKALSLEQAWGKSSVAASPTKRRL